MIRVMIWMGICSILTIYGVFSAKTPVKENIRIYWRLTNCIVDTAAEISASKKMLQLIKSPEDALTLSRYNKEGKIHTIGVLQDDGENITGVDLSLVLNRFDVNSFDVIKDLEYNEIVRIINDSSNRVSISYRQLLPSIAGDKHLAIGINYAEHGKETGQVRPFMFPELLSTDPPIHSLHYKEEWLLDHEVELGIVFPRGVCSPIDIDKMMMGFLVVNDFTDRAELMRKMDSKNVTGGKGFPDAKSKTGFLPTGPYLVIPRDWRSFVNDLELQLSVNGQLRQRGFAKDMVWDIEKIISHSLSAKGLNNSYYKDKMIKLFEGDCIPANSIIITGTPAGVVFNAPTGSFIFGSVMKYIFAGGFFNNEMHPYIMKQYLKKELSNPKYLKPGDYVETSIKYLGTIKTKVEK
ncbi:MAG: fumarylacetoacetate hydrolase family protein [Chryseobacterium culicis]